MHSDMSLYSASDLAIVVPTKDRRSYVHSLLECLVRQTTPPGQVVVVASGERISDLVDSYSDDLNLLYIHTAPGQIRQRNIGIDHVCQDAQLIAFIDDKVLLEPDAIEKMIACWNKVPAESAGIGFNIINGQQNAYSWRYGVLLYDSPKPGRVLRSGCNVTFFNISEDIRVEWLGGGYSVWRRDVLNEFPQAELKTRWAVGEDLRYSYPIGKKYPLWACASAKVHNRVVTDQVDSEDVLFYRNRLWAIAVLYFSYTEPRMRLLACVWMILGVVTVDFVYGIKLSNKQQIETAKGRLRGFIEFMAAFLLGKRLESLLED